MAFPYPGETFAGTDVRSLLREGVEVSVHSLRPRHPRARTLAAQWGIGAASLSHGGVRSTLAGLGWALRRPGLLVAAMGFAAAAARKPRLLVRTLALVPRSLSIVAEIERARPDVVHLFWGHYPALVARLVQRRLPNVVTSVFLGAYDLAQGHPASGPAARQADAVWTHARANEAELLALGVDASRLRVAHRGLDLGKLPAPREKVPGMIVTVARLIASKGVDTALEVFRDVLATHPSAALVVIGDGVERARLEAYAERLGVAEQVRFRGQLDHDRVLEEVASAEVMLFLSRKASERLPNVVKEAMACGCYCVASKTPGMHELVPDAEHGAVVDASAPDEVVAAVRRALDRPELRARVAATARRHIEAHFDVDATMACYLRVWRDAVERRRASAADRAGSSTPGSAQAP